MNQLMLLTALGVWFAPPAADATAPMAAGIYVVGNAKATFAFGVEPWTADAYQVRGLAWFAREFDDPRAAFCVILGTYRPERQHEARGVFLYEQPKSGQTTTLAWSGRFDPQQQSFPWSVEVAGKSHALQAAKAWIPPTADAASSERSPPSPADNTTGLFQRSPDDNGIDLGEMILDTIEISANRSKPSSSPAPKQVDAKPVDPNKPPSASAGEVGNLGIINALTDIGRGKPGWIKPPGEFLDEAIRLTSPGEAPIRRRREYPPLDAPRELKTLSKPGAADVPSTRTVPGVVGMRFEDAVNVLWSAGLNPSSVECLGHAKDPAQSNHVVSQTPAAGAPYPADGNMRLQWYADIEHPPGTPDGFRPGDGVKVDVHFIDAQTNGRSIGRAGFANDESVSWSIFKLDDPQTQEAVASVRKSIRETMALVVDKKNELGTTAIMQRGDVAGDLIFAYTSYGHPNPIFRDRTHHYRLHEYRGFLIWYLHSKEGRSQPLAAVADTVLENSRRLIDLRFPK